VYIAGLTHSGSTLLDLLISSHSQVVSGGELKHLDNAPESMPCTCGVTPFTDCGFWRSVNQRLQASSDLRLTDLELESSDQGRFSEHNLALFRAMVAASGKTVVVDSSKNANRLARILAIEGLDTEVIHLTRHPFGVVYSQIRKGRSLARYAFASPLKQNALKRLLRHRPRLRVDYEQLTAKPGEVLDTLMAELGLVFEPQQLDFADQEHHNIGGNRMRFSSDSAIQTDLEWQTKLGPARKLAIALLMAAARVPGVWRLRSAWRSVGRRFSNRQTPDPPY
jgi:hypothetical protein